MAENKKKEKDDEYVTLRLECKKSVYVTTTGYVDIKVPRANRRRIRPNYGNLSQFAEWLDQSNCIEWAENKPGYWSHLLWDVKQLPDSDQAYRCRFNPKTQEWEFVFGDGTAPRAKEDDDDNN
jgi:hypothetical protein